MVKGDKLSGDGRTIMAVSCCPMQHILKCKMETRNLFIYLFVISEGVSSADCHFREPCLDALNRLRRLTLCDNKAHNELKDQIRTASQAGLRGSKQILALYCFFF